MMLRDRKDADPDLVDKALLLMPMHPEEAKVSSSLKA
jgi:hypothetical protein